MRFVRIILILSAIVCAGLWYFNPVPVIPPIVWKYLAFGLAGIWSVIAFTGLVLERGFWRALGTLIFRPFFVASVLFMGVVWLGFAFALIPVLPLDILIMGAIGAAMLDGIQDAYEDYW